MRESRRILGEIVPKLTREEHRWLVAVPATVVLTPAPIVAVSLLFLVVNSLAGRFLVAPPSFVYFLYLALIFVALPAGLLTLVLAQVEWARFRDMTSGHEARHHRRVLVVAVLAMPLDALWVFLIPFVVLPSGGSR
jgi:hypothetical protein